MRTCRSSFVAARFGEHGDMSAVVDSSPSREYETRAISQSTLAGSTIVAELGYESSNTSGKLRHGAFSIEGFSVCGYASCCDGLQYRMVSAPLSMGTCGSAGTVWVEV
jgi:hypothetical protein